MHQPFTSFQEFRKRYPIRPNDEGALLGSGSYGRVIKVEDQVETEWVAIKISEFKGNDPKSLKAEVELAQRLSRQANIARYDACYRLETDTSVSDFAIMKYYPDGNLADLLRKETLSATQIYDLTRGILMGLQHLHRHRIVHRDFKPANILISRDNSGRFIPKIADFGLSKLVNDDELDSSDFDLSDGRGTPSYKAPEQIEGSRVSFNLDLWAFGVILYEMMTGEKPFRSDLRNSSEQSVRREIEKKIVTVDLPTRLGQVAEPYQAMIRRCLVRDIHERVRKEDELLDLMDTIPQLLSQARQFVQDNQYAKAIATFEQIVSKREHHAEAIRGIEQCRKAMLDQKVAELIVQAEQFRSRQAFEEAIKQYEEILTLVPTHEAAVRGIAICQEQLRPKTIVIESEETDAYEDIRTDAYVAPTPPVPAVAKRLEESVKVVTNGPSEKFSAVAVPPGGKGRPKPGPISSVPASTIGRTFPWKVVAPVVVVLGVGMFYYTRQPAATDTKDVRSAGTSKAEENHKAVVIPSPIHKTDKIEPAPVLKPVAGETKDALTERINTALVKAQRAYRRKNFDEVLLLTSSARLLDPTRKDVVALYTAAANAKKAIVTLPAGSSASVTTTEPLKVPVSAEKKPDEAAEDANEKRRKEKQQQQDAYDQLIEEGVKAIANGNNKAKAIASFSKAQGLAKEQDLNTAKAEAAYATYMTKANKIFANDEFEGAKEWYQVAKSIKDTDEVRRKIKLSTNQ